jgi:putative membrane protein
MKVLSALIVAAVSAAPVFAASSSTDADFVTKAAQAGMAEVAAGKLAASKGESPAVKKFGQRMVRDHTKANEELKSVASKSGATVPASTSPEQKAAGQQLETMQGAEFDEAYARQMVKDHEEAVELFRKESTSGSDAGLKAFAAKTLPTLQQHLEMAKELPPGGGGTSPGSQ